MHHPLDRSDDAGVRRLTENSKPRFRFAHRERLLQLHEEG
jgi:hypothetical protein